MAIMQLYVEACFKKVQTDCERCDMCKDIIYGNQYQFGYLFNGHDFVEDDDGCMYLCQSCMDCIVCEFPELKII